MPSDSTRLEALKKAAAKANPIGFVSVLTRDLRWLLELAETPPRKANGHAANSVNSPDQSSESAHDAERN